MKTWLRTNGVTLLACLAVAIGVLTTVRASALSRKFASPSAVAVVDWIAVTDKVDEWKESEAQMRKMQDGLVEELTAYEKRLKDLSESIGVLPEGSESREREQDKLNRLSLEADGLLNYMKNRMGLEKAKRQIRLYQKISAAVAKVAERDGWDVVIWDDSKNKYPDLDPKKLEAAAELIGRRQVFYARKDAVDITDEVILLMNNEFNAGP